MNLPLTCAFFEIQLAEAISIPINDAESPSLETSTLNPYLEKCIKFKALRSIFQVGPKETYRAR